MKRSAWLIAAALLLCGLREPTQAAVQTGAAPTESRLRLVPQSTDTLLADMEESADGTRLITHDRKFAPRLWDAKTLRLLRVLGGAQDPTPVVRFSRDGKRILTMGTEELRVWDATMAKVASRYPGPDGEFFVEAVFSPDGSMVAVSSSSGIVRVINASTGKLIKELTGLEVFVPALDWSGDGKFLAAGSRLSACIWNVQSGAKVTLTAPKMTSIRSLDFNDAGTSVVVSNVNEGAFVFDATTGKLRYELAHVIGDRTEELRAMVGAQFVGKSEASVLYFDKGGDLVVVNAVSGVEEKRLKGHSAPVDELRLNRNRTRAGTHGDDDRVILWDLEAAKQTPFELKRGDMPTAATFGAQADDWYLGMASGEIRRYDIKTGIATSGTLGATNSLARIRFLGAERLLTISKNATGSLFLDNLSESKILVIPATSMSDPLDRLADELFSDSGRFNISASTGSIFYPPFQFSGYDLWSGDGMFKSNSSEGQIAEFAPNSDLAMLTFQDGLVFCYDFSIGKQTHTAKYPDPQEDFTGAISPDGSNAVHGPYTKDRTYAVWQLDTREILAVLDKAADMKIKALKYSPDGKLIAGAGEKAIAWWDVATGNLVGQSTHGMEDAPEQLVFTRDGARIIAHSPTAFAVATVKTPGVASFQQGTSWFLKRDMDQMANRAGTKVLLTGRNKVYVYDVDGKKEEKTLELNDTAVNAIFSPDDSRILTVDLTDGIVIWDAKTYEKLGNLVQMRDGSWLVMDTEGRYDANDPNDVEGALYVMEWEGGLEALDVNQFKGYFWDPGLLQKLLGTSKEKKRSVPSLASLRLYPQADLKPDKKGGVVVALEPRDDGGIGRVSVSVNGKEVVTKAGVGYFNVNLEDLRPHLLPENRLPEGQGNIVSVRVSNSEGTLTSLPTNLDIGVPVGLKAPEIKLYALFVGAGDYVGTTRDLTAPPKDAEALANAVRRVSGGFLSNRVEITELATEDEHQPPTKANVLKWFDDVAKKATSSDIVMVFFAGHGMDKLGSRTGYYFLTSEADPESLTEANLPNVSVSGEDLRVKLKAIAANKQVVILDTCHSGAAAGSIVDGSERSVSGDYQRAWEAIKDATGTWMLAGSAADQLSYESSNVDHGMLTYSLLEAIDKANSDGLRPGQGGELFVDIERWLTYAANRVESLKNEVGLKGIQRPEFKRSTGRGSFDIGVLNEKDRGAVGLKPPLPIVIVGPFELDQEDPEGLEDPIRAAFTSSNQFKAWTDVSKHPNVYRIAGEYSVSGNKVTVKVFLQRFDSGQKRSTIETFEVTGDKGRLPALAAEIKSEVEKKVVALELARKAPQP